MATICLTSADVTSVHTGGTIVRGSLYIDYSISDQYDRVVISSKMCIAYSCQTLKGSTMVDAALYTGSNWSVHDSTFYADQAHAQGRIISSSDSKSTDAAALQTKTIYKTHSTQTVNVTAYYSHAYIRAGLGGSSDRAYNEATLASSKSITAALPTISAKKNWPIYFNANGGTSAPATATKWYNETLTLPTGIPTKTGFTFKGWATSSTGAVAYYPGGSYTANPSTASVTLYAVWERDSYSVTYNANGGTGAPSTQTKYYAIDLPLSSTVPSLNNYTFKGWATSTSRASSGTVDYIKGATYTGNTALSLYAVWELTHTSPVISQPLSIARCRSNGQVYDEGQYAKITFDWSIFVSSLPRYYGGTGAPYSGNHVATCTVTVGSTSKSVTLSGTSSGNTPVPVTVGTNDDFLTDSQYPVTVSITDAPDTSYSGVTALTTTVSGVLPMTFFPMDFNEDATAVGFFMPAPTSGEGSGAYFAKDVTLKEQFYIYVDETAGSGDDHNIKQVLDTFDWTSDVLV